MAIYMSAVSVDGKPPLLRMVVFSESDLIQGSSALRLLTPSVLMEFSSRFRNRSIQLLRKVATAMTSNGGITNGPRITGRPTFRSPIQAKKDGTQSRFHA